MKLALRKKSAAVVKRTEDKRPWITRIFTRGKTPIKHLPFFSKLSKSLGVNWEGLGRGVKLFEMRSAEIDLELFGKKYTLTAGTSMIGRSISLGRSDGSQFLNKQRLFGAIKNLAPKPIEKMGNGDFIKLGGFLPIGSGVVFAKGHATKDDGGYTVSLHLSPAKKVFGKPITLGSNVASIIYSEAGSSTMSILASEGRGTRPILEFLEDLIEK